MSNVQDREARSPGKVYEGEAPEGVPADADPAGAPRSLEEPGTLGAYVQFSLALSSDNAIARRFISAGHLLARGMLVSTVFHLIRSLGFDWEESARRTGEMVGMSRSTVARAVKDVDDITRFWDESGYHMVDVEAVTSRIGDLAKRRLEAALQEEAGGAQPKEEQVEEDDL